MQVLDSKTKFAHLGKAGSSFTPGFARRLQKIQQKVNLHDKKILDIGCGEGVWLKQFAELSGYIANVYGCDIDKEAVESIIDKVDIRGDIPKQNLKVCAAENLGFADQEFDIVFANEVLEHVQDDQLTVNEVLRVLKPGGLFVFFTPNTGWPFEQHGIFWQGRYIWGNIPLLPWLPKAIQKNLAPHVRNYTNRDVKQLFDNTTWQIKHHRHVFPGFDGMIRRFGIIGKLVKKFFHILEKTPLHRFGISHFVIVKKTMSP